jgi:formylglycine-generating enzyme required for sulfatase activity
MITLRVNERGVAALCFWIEATVIALGSVACAPPMNIAGDTLKGTTTSDAFEGVRCSAVRPQTKPDLMAWDSGSRAELNRLRREGVVAVRYRAKGCDVELELLSNCIGRGSKYQFTAENVNERKVAHNASELFAQLPLGAGAVSGKLNGGRVLRTDYMLAGQYSLPPDASFRASDLKGPDCAGATHVISAIYVGAFVMGAGESRAMDANASLFGSRSSLDSKADIDVFHNEGDAESCAAAQKDRKESDGCAVPLRIGLLALDTAVVATTTRPPPYSASTAAESGGMARIPAGTFTMGSPDGEGDANEHPPHQVTVAAFEMDVTEVTVAGYGACVSTGQCTAAYTSAEGTTDNAACNYGKSEKSNHPINCVNRRQAASYCGSQGKRLPTEEEWEYAARGGTEARVYSWGNAEPALQLCWSGISKREGTCAVGSFAKGAFGLADMTGNVEEWTASGYSEDYGKPRVDIIRVTRGGTWKDDRLSSVRGAQRHGWIGALNRGSDLGFRCAR